MASNEENLRGNSSKIQEILDQPTDSEPLENSESIGNEGPKRNLRKRKFQDLSESKLPTGNIPNK